ncbi:translocation and assembly module lipoprotein TamL [Sediminibacterium ginsengisoli]|uniref:Outer membrane protein assembly factor BamA n=1 Tax=Sediminibacterium ginsengisoli TaxID=413434 RepID=A0A1T4Q002_9BACT|nr:BamA/TamA family outer membrane protein [Sediminibacterium ginsengisoli]SJZ97140.1 Outer membrane protein assembly factor BamA [Sediminibacterium ginsengisoli]
MKKNAKYILFACLVMFCACNVSRKLPAGTQLYNGAKYTIEKEDDNKAKTGSVKSQLKKITLPRKNKMILGFPYKVWFWYAIGEPKKQKGFKYWLRNKFGEPPVLSTVVNTEATSESFAAYLENKGYFRTTAKGDTTVKGYKVTANYTVKLGMPYSINHVQWVLDSNQEISTDISRMDEKENYLRKKDQFDLDNVKAERTRTDLFLKTKGYYYFSPDYIKGWIDSSAGNHQVNIFMRLKDSIPVAADLPQRIGRITVFPNYTLLKPPPDTSKRGLLEYDGIYIRDTMNRIKPSALVRSITYRSDSLYNIKEHNKTLNRFINMGLFKFVKSRYEGSRDSNNSRYLDVYYYLTPMKKKTINAEIGGFTKSNSFTGGQLNVNWKNRNTFGGAEQLNIKGYTSFESSSVDSLRGNSNYRLGGEVSLLFPRFVTPFRIRESNYFPPKTRFSVSYEWMRRQSLYTKNFFRFQYDLTWKESPNKEHTLGPVSITYNNTTNTTDEFLNQLAQLPSLRYTSLPELIVGSFYNFVFNSVNPNAKNIFYFNGNAEAAGNIAGLVNKAAVPYSAKLFGAYYAQYAKLDLDFRYTRKLGDDLYLANRVILGAGFPYGNSSFLPFSKQYIIGGSSSLRGFSPRQIAGRILTSAVQQAYLPQVGGDYKLELNSELRFPIAGKLKGAVFADAGNIWTKDTLIYGGGSKLTSSFLKDIAVDAGVGLRFDVTILIIRLDVAAPLRKPWLPRGQEWVIRDIDIFNSGWRRDNIVYNIGISYPF